LSTCFTSLVAWIFSAGAGLGEVDGRRTFQRFVLQEQTRAPAFVLFSLSAGTVLYVYGDSLTRSRVTRVGPLSASRSHILIVSSLRLAMLQWAKAALLESSDGMEPLHNAKQVLPCSDFTFTHARHCWATTADLFIVLLLYTA